VIRGLSKLGIEPDIVTGSSIGAFVGAAYASNQIDKLENWACSLLRKDEYVCDECNRFWSNY